MPVPTVDDFYAFFPQFEDADEVDVQASLNQASLWVDPTIWNSADYAAGVLYLAAHFLQLAGEAAANAGGDTGGGSGTVSTFLSRVSVGDRSVMWRAAPGAGAKGGGGFGASEQFFDLSTYGQTFLMLRNRNVFPIRVLNNRLIG